MRHTNMGNPIYHGETAQEANHRAWREQELRRQQEEFDRKYKKEVSTSDFGGTSTEGELTGLGRIIQVGGGLLILASLFGSIGIEWFGSTSMGIGIGVAMLAIKYVATILPYLTSMAAILFLVSGYGEGQGWLSISESAWIMAGIFFFGGWIVRGFIVAYE
jgi:hypothetical protein